MSTYNIYSTVVEHTVCHRFTCKYCEHMSDWIPTAVRGSGALRFNTGIGSTINKYDTERQLNSLAQRDLQKKINIMKKYTAKGYRLNAPFWIKSGKSYHFDTKCSNCKKMQGTRMIRHLFSAIGSCVLLLFMVAIVTTEWIELSDNTILVLWWVCVLIPLLLFFYWRKNYRKKMKTPLLIEYNWNGR